MCFVVVCAGSVCLRLSVVGVNCVSVQTRVVDTATAHMISALEDLHEKALNDKEEMAQRIHVMKLYI